jgi:hypothetical protein
MYARGSGGGGAVGDGGCERGGDRGAIMIAASWCSVLVVQVVRLTYTLNLLSRLPEPTYTWLIYIYIYIYIYIDIHTYIHTYMYIYIYI